MKRIAVLFAVVVGAVTLASVAREPAASSPPAQVRPGSNLLTVEIHGPASVTANAPESYKLVARYTDGTKVDVTDQAEWSVDSPYAQFTQGVLTVSPMADSPALVLTAWYTDGLSLKATLVVTRKDAGERVSPEEEKPEKTMPVGRLLHRGGEGPEEGTRSKGSGESES